VAARKVLVGDRTSHSSICPTTGPAPAFSSFRSTARMGSGTLRSVTPTKAASAPTTDSKKLERGLSLIDDKIEKLLHVEQQEAGPKVLELCLAFVIMLNALTMVLEVDLAPRGAKLSDRIGWFLVETMFTIIYIIELVCRIHVERRAWIRSWWNWLDLVVVVVGITDNWLLPMAMQDEASSGSNYLTLVSMLRMARLARLIRLIKLVRMFRGLYLMVMAFKNAMKSVFWIVILMTIGLLACSVCATVMIGHDERFRDVIIRGDSAMDRFGSVPASMYSLFELMTLEDWHEIGRPLILAQPILFVFIVGFLIVFTFGLLNMIVGMVVERTLNFAKQQDASEERKTKTQFAKDLMALKDVFRDADLDRSGSIQLDDFELAVKENEEVRGVLEALDIPCLDAIELFRILDVEGVGSLSVETWVEGFAKVLGAVSTRWDEMKTACGVRMLVRQSLEARARKATLPDQAPGTDWQQAVLQRLDEQAANQAEIIKRLQALEDSVPTRSGSIATVVRAGEGRVSSKVSEAVVCE